MQKINSNQKNTMTMNKVLCILCARGGSKRLKKKNSKNLFGKPLIYHSIKQAINSKIFDKVVFSTDSNKLQKMAIKMILLLYLPMVKWCQRNAFRVLKLKMVQ